MEDLEKVQYRMSVSDFDRDERPTGDTDWWFVAGIAGFAGTG